MKLRSLICVSAVAAAMSAAATTTVTSGNTFCRFPVTSGFTNTIIALPFSGCGESQMQIYVTNLVMTANLSNGDTLLWKSGSQWYGWEISGGNWVPIATANQTAWNAGVLAEETAIPCGQACWLNRSNTAQPFYLYGQVNTNLAAVTVAAGTGSTPTYTLIGYPTEQTALDLSAWNKGNNGDVIVVPASNAQGYKEYCRVDDAWKTKSVSTSTQTITRNGRTKTVTTTSVSYVATTSEDTIAPGLGFMYGRLAASALELW